ncbi:MAG TPA: GAF domain-containing protein [Candidatus Bathyarchaeia archaeon]|nr:GAF domain-containing protein [Candidatus Bathyarchaeia archaeon]
MKTVLLVAEDEALGAKLLRALTDYSVFPAHTNEEALRTLRLTEVDLILKHASRPARDLDGFLAKARQLRPTAVVVCILPAEGLSAEDELAAEEADFALLYPFTSQHVQAVLRQADEKLRLLQELAALRSQRRPAGPEPVVDEGEPAFDASPRELTQVAKEFAKALAAGFDLPRVLELFLDAVSELARPSRSAILLSEDEHRQYRVRASRGLTPLVVESVSLPADSGLPLWLMAEGRLIQIEEAQARSVDAAAREIAREMAVLQAVVAIPLSSHGQLVGILTLGQRITGGAYSRRETETLFNLASHLATAIRDIRVHHQLQYQKEFNERILQRMSSGVVTIGPEQRVVIMNRRAEEILGMAARDVLNRDLRVLPSPLGDLLFETLSRGHSVIRSEVQLALRSLPLEVSTYPVMGEGTAPLGAVVVFEDLTAQRQLAMERRHAEQLQLLTRVVARIADEIKNPLVSINAFMELLQERYDDVSFRHHFTSVVGRDVRRLVQMFDKLAALVNEGDYKRDVVDIRGAIEESLVEMGAAEMPIIPSDAHLLSFTDDSTQKLVTVNFSHEGGPFLVKGDRSMLKKAVAYLIWYLLRKTPGQEAKIAVGVSAMAAAEPLRITVASRTAEVRPDELLRIFDPIQVVQENLIDVGPCVSQRILEAQGGHLDIKQGRAEVTFTATLPTTQP